MTLVKLLIATVCTLVIAAILFPMFAKAKVGDGRHRCLSQVKQLLNATSAYEVDYDDHLMPAPSWMDATGPYAKNVNLYNCPDLLPKGSRFGIAMNRFLSGHEVGKLADPSKQHLVYDSNLTERNANEYLPSFPIPGRRRGVNTIGYADGHANVIRMGVFKQ